MPRTPESGGSSTQRGEVAARRQSEVIPLASSYPVVESLTPRARRRRALEEKTLAKRRMNESRARAAAAKRAKIARHATGAENSTVGANSNRQRRQTTHGSGRALRKRAQSASRAPSAASEEEEASALEKYVSELEKERDGFLGQNKEYLSKIEEYTDQIEELQSENQALKESGSQLEGKVESLSAQLADAGRAIQSQESELDLAARTIKGLRNQVLELKGNIRVFVRVRPQLKSEDPATPTPFSFPCDDPEKQHLTLFGKEKESFDGRNSSRPSWDFKFDKVFHEYATQKDVFEEVTHLVQSALDGYRVCIFAYGQTGSGKTYTMEGDSGDSAAGIIPRSVDQLFQVISTDSKRGWRFQLRASFLEIYNETLRDLSDGSTLKGDIRHTSDGDTVVPGLKEVLVASREDLHRLLESARKSRSVGATACNERSSRSHSAFVLTLLGTHEASGEEVRGVLNLVDLAGSEKLSSSRVEGQQRLKETQCINKSLSSLGDVIFALGNRKKHVPFRNSKLTYLLQNSLGGNCKTLMLVNLSPGSAQESLCSLRFASKVNSCQIGTARVVKHAP